MENEQSLKIKTHSCHRDLGGSGTELKTSFKFARVMSFTFSVSFVEVPDLQLSRVNCKNESFWLESVLGYERVFLAFLWQQGLGNDAVKQKEIKTRLELLVSFQGKN